MILYGCHFAIKSDFWGRHEARSDNRKVWIKGVQIMGLLLYNCLLFYMISSYKINKLWIECYCTWQILDMQHRAQVKGIIHSVRYDKHD